MKTKYWVSAVALSTVAASVLLPAFVSAQGMGRGGFGAGERPGFETLDLDGDGNLTVAEFKEHAQSRFGAADSNGDGLLSAEELTEAAAARAAERAALMIARMIEWRDQDGDGALSPSELTDNNGERMFLRLDADDDGVITAEEFAQAENRGQRGGKGHDGRRHGKGERRGG